LMGMDANVDVRKHERGTSWKWEEKEGRYVPQDIPVSDDVFELLRGKEGWRPMYPEKGVTVLKERSFFSDQESKRGVPTFETVDVVCIWTPRSRMGPRESKFVGMDSFDGIDYGITVNATYKHMLPNLHEPSDHKGIVGWVEWT